MDKNNQRGITWKLNTGEQSFLYATHGINIIHIPISFHEDITHDYQVIGFKYKNNTKRAKHKNKKEK